jgi:hypothetical protein
MSSQLNRNRASKVPIAIVHLVQLLDGYGARDPHYDPFGRVTEGEPCARGWFEKLEEAQRASRLFIDRGFRTTIELDENAGREWYWLAVR